MTDARPQVTIYTDGACSGNPGPGGWGAVLRMGDHYKELSGYEPQTTNNRMEFMAAIKALEALKVPCKVFLHSDSALLIDGFNKSWVSNWQRRGWVKSTKEPVKNVDLWEQLLALTKVHDVTWVKVKGHAGIQDNERCDVLARGAITARGSVSA